MRLAPLFLVALILTGCTATSSSSGPTVGVDLRTPAGAERGTAWQGNRSVVSERVEAVARTADEWQALWAKVGVPAPESLPDSRMAVALFLGTRATGGHAVSLAPPTDRGTSVMVPYRETVPGPNDSVDQQPTSPFAIRLIDRTPQPVRFVLAP